MGRRMHGLMVDMRVDISCKFQVLLLHLDHNMRLLRGHQFSMTSPAREKNPHFGIVHTVHLMLDEHVDLMQQRHAKVIALWHWCITLIKSKSLSCRDYVFKLHYW